MTNKKRTWFDYFLILFFYHYFDRYIVSVFKRFGNFSE